MRSYQTARNVFSIFEVLAWGMVIIGVLIAFGLATGISSFSGNSSILQKILVALPGLGISFFGLVGVVFVEVARATVDSAEYGQQSLKVARDHLEISRQGLMTPSAFPTTYEAIEKEDPTTKRFSFTNEESIPEPVAQDGDVIEYEGKEISVENGKFMYNGIPFKTEEMAIRYIDQLLV